MLRYLSAICGILLFPLTILANGTLSGTVKNADTGETLSGANILIHEADLGAASGENGEFTIRNIPTGAYTVSASYIGYHVQKKTVVLSDGRNRIHFALKPAVIPGQNITVTATRARRHESPVTFTDVSREEIETRWHVEDVPLFLEEIPNVYSYSESGNGIGYSYMKIRGFDQRRLNISINGIPLNDPEDHNVYWVDIPNLLANVEDIQVQRGIGSSMYGQNAFGGSVNLVTSNFTNERRMRLQAGYGSYNTRKYSFDFQSGLIENTYSFYGRFSRITTDGYRDAAWSDLWSYFLSGVRFDENRTTKINIYGGPEKSHAAWDGSPESALKENHQHNPYSDYANETDNFNQPHYELIHDWSLSNNVTLHNSLFYIRGDGYYEQLKEDEDLWLYGVAQSPDSISGDLVRQKWVEKDQYGWIPRLDIDHGNGNLKIGAEVSTYSGLHYGKVLSLEQIDVLPDTLVTPADQYYNFNGDKSWISMYAHELYDITPAIQAMVDLQYQYKTYAFQQNERGNFKDDQLNRFEVTYNFFNPKFGLNYSFSEDLSAYISAGTAHREPSDADLYDTFKGPDDLGVDPLFANVDTVRDSQGHVQHLKWSEPYTKPERLTDYELGLNYTGHRYSLNVTGYLMLFNNEIVAYGGVDDEGTPIKGNAESTIHRGIEFAGSAALTRDLKVSGNVSVSQNYFGEFIATEYSTDWTSVVQNDYSGNPITLFPGVLGNLRVTYTLAQLRSSLSLRHVGKQYLDNTGNDNRIVDPYTTVDFSTDFRTEKFTGLSGVKIGVQVNNLMDKVYETTGYWYGERYLYPAAGRNYFVSLSLEL